MTRPTFSALPRLFACPASHILPHTRIDEPSEYRDRGTAIHAYLDDVSKGVDDPLSRVPEEHRETCEAIPLDDLPTNLSHEVAFAFDPTRRTARILKQRHHRDYSEAEDHEITGQVDVVGVSPSAVFVGDYKSGWARQIPAGDNPQLLAGGLCAAKVFDRPAALLDVISVRENRPPWHDRAEVDAFDLMAFEERLVKLHHHLRSLARIHSITGELPEPIPGDHCRYCPAFEACPAQTQLAIIATDGSLAEEVEREWAGILRADNAAEAYGKAKAMMQLAVRAKEIVRAYARKHPIPLDNGMVYGLVERPGIERLDGDVVFTQAVRLWGHDLANAVCGRTSTKKAITAGLRSHKASLGMTQRAALQALLVATRDAGGAKRKPSSRVEEYKV